MTHGTTLNFHIITLFPEMFSGPLSESILKRAQSRGIISVHLYDLRDFAEDKHKTVDDTPYGGGPGMVLKVDVIDKAIKAVKESVAKDTGRHIRTILLTPQGEPFIQRKARQLTEYTDLIMICGHYEGFDERVRQHLVDEEISLGDFVLSGGEIAAMAIVDAVSRLIPGVLGKDESSAEESFSLTDEKNKPLLEYPVYTRPLEYKGWSVPDVLKSGNHEEITRWRMAEAKKRTVDKRPDILR